MLFSEHFGILFGTLWIVLEQIWNSFHKQFWMFENFYWELFGYFLQNTLKCSQNNSLMLRNIFWNVLLTFLKVQNYFQNMLALFRALWFVLYKIWLCFIEQFWTFDNFFFELFRCFIRNTLKCFPNNSWMFRNIFWNVLLTF